MSNRYLGGYIGRLKKKLRQSEKDREDWCRAFCHEQEKQKTLTLQVEAGKAAQANLIHLIQQKDKVIDHLLGLLEKAAK